MNAQDIVQQFLDALAAHDADGMAQCLVDEMVYRPEPTVELQKQHYLSSVQALHTGMPNFQYTFENWRTDGSEVTVNVGAHGTHTGTFAFPAPGYPVVEATGKPITFTAFDWTFTVQDNLIVQLVFQQVPNGDIINILRQMGAPMPGE